MSELLQAAQSALVEGRPADSAAICERILQAEGENPSALLILGLCARQQGQLEQAEQSLRRACVASGDAVEVLNALGLVLSEQGRQGEAIALYERALASHPGYAKCHNNLGNALKDSGRAADSLAHFEQAIALAPDYAEAHYNLGNALGDLKRYDQAVEAYRRCLALVPRLFEAQVRLGTTLAASDRQEEAYEALTKAASLQPREADIYRLLGDIALSLGHTDVARSYFDHAFALVPDKRHRQGHRRLAIALLEKGDHEAAWRCLMGPLRILSDPAGPPRPEPVRASSPIKLRHSLEQLDHLERCGLLAQPYEEARAACRAALDLPPGQSDNHAVTLPADLAAKIDCIENRLLHYDSAPALTAGAVSPAIDADAVEAEFARTAPGIACIDGLLTDAALDSLRRFCRDSTIWWQIEHGNEIGTSLVNGFCCPLILQIATELRQALPGLLGPHGFVTAWAYKYYPPPRDSEPNRSSGLDVHADDGAVSLNFWITPDEANLDPDGGGMVFWNGSVPDDYFRTQTRGERLAIVEPLHAQAGAPVARFPHRANRGILFRSNTLHQSEQFRFRDDYESRRISITMAFGRRTTP